MSAFKSKFKAVSTSSVDEQCDFFCKRYVFTLADGIKDVQALAKAFKEALTNQKMEGNELDGTAAGQFLEKNGKLRTALQRKQELQDVDADNNGKTSFLEYLCLHFKVMILQEHFKRKGTEPDVDLSNDGVGLVGVGEILIEELFSPPAGVDPLLEKMMAEFSLEHTKREKKIEELEAIVAAGGVKGMAAKSQLEALKNQDASATHALEAKIAAAIKKAAKKAEDEFEAKKGEVAAKDLPSPKGKLGEKAALFSGGSTPKP